MSTAPVLPRWAAVVPGWWQLRTYRRGFLRGDVVAGLAVAAYLVPQVMAYAELAGLSAVHGLWAAVGPLLLYAIFGSSKTLSVGPESTTALMTAVAIVAVTNGNAALAPAAAAALALAVGLVCLIGWLARLGYVADLLSRPVLIGYLAGIAVLMIVSQLGKVTGIDIPSGSTVAEFWYAVTHLGLGHLPTLVVATAVLAFLLAGRAWKPTFPWVLVAMVAAAVVVAVIGADRFGLAVVGEVPRGLPAPRIPELAQLDLAQVLLAAVGVAAVGFTDNVLTGRAFVRRDDEPPLNASQELLALGTANIGAGLLQGFPVSSSGSRTAVIVSGGGRTQVASLSALAVIVAVLLFAGPLLATFPMAALGGVVVYAATRLVDVAGFRSLARFRVSELVLALATTVAVLAFDVLIGIAVAIGLSVLNLLRRISRPHDAILGFVPGRAGMHDIDDYAGASQVPGLLLYRFDAPLFFAAADNFRARALQAVADVERTGAPVRWFVLNAEANTEIDFTAIQTLEELRAELQDRGITMGLARVTFEVQADLERAGFVAAIGPDHVYATLPTAVQAYRDWAEQHPGHPEPQHPERPHPL